MSNQWDVWDSGNVVEVCDTHWHSPGEVALRLSLAANLQGHFSPDKMLLDVGCGSGLLYRDLLKANLTTPDTYHGLDISLKMLALARGRNPGIMFREGSVYKTLPSSPQILCSHVLQHLPDYKEPIQNLWNAATDILAITTWLTDGDDIIRHEPCGELFGYNNDYSRPKMMDFLVSLGTANINVYPLTDNGSHHHLILIQK